jgi:lysophospholipase L1-like esterase
MPVSIGTNLLIMNRREFLTATAASIAASAVLSPRSSFAQQSKPTTTTAAATTAATQPDKFAWHDVREWGVEGRGFDDTEKYYDRLPARANGKVPGAVWYLSRQTAGMFTQFQTDADTIKVRYRLNSDTLGMAHMPATGVSGVDLYARNDGAWHWLGVVLPKSRDITDTLATALAPGSRTYRLHLPLYNGVESLEIGVPKAASFTPLPERKEKPVLYYGTSIAQGACASRPGMAYTNILARRLDRTVLNFGFSGSGKMEIEVGQFLAEIDPSVVVLDCLPNCTPEITATHTEPLVRLFRKEHPNTPILLVEDRTMDSAFLRPDLQQLHTARRAAYRKAYENLQQAGVTNLHYLEGKDLLGHDGEATTDGSHPNDLGMVRHADALEPVLRPLLAS